MNIRSGLLGKHSILLMRVSDWEGSYAYWNSTLLHIELENDEYKAHQGAIHRCQEEKGKKNDETKRIIHIYIRTRNLIQTKKRRTSFKNKTVSYISNGVNGERIEKREHLIFWNEKVFVIKMWKTASDFPLSASTFTLFSV